jgi:hypothetical protein
LAAATQLWAAGPWRQLLAKLASYQRAAGAASCVCVWGGTVQAAFSAKMFESGVGLRIPSSVLKQRSYVPPKTNAIRRREALDSQLGTLLGKKAEPVGGYNGGGGIARRRPCGNGRSPAQKPQKSMALACKARQSIRRPTADPVLCPAGRGQAPKAGRGRWIPPLLRGNHQGFQKKHSHRLYMPFSPFCKLSLLAPLLAPPLHHCWHHHCWHHHCWHHHCWHHHCHCYRHCWCTPRLIQPVG